MTFSESGLQDQFCSSYDKTKLCSYDVEIIKGPTKPLIHQAARFLLFGKGKGVMKINEKSYDLNPGSFAAILPWDSSEVTEVSEPLQFVKIIYSYDFVNQFLRINGSAPANVTSFMAACPVVNLNEQEMKLIQQICRSIKSEVGVESAYAVRQEKELSELLVGNKIAELMINFKRLILKRGTVEPQRSNASPNKAGIFKYMYS
ncbi:MAG: AraC family transcriptional regulator, partial [Erysipelotrichaceae bacterium]|nr:AraC family transcriptional regulator [Erysipelotrichaceae bacterium]